MWVKVFGPDCDPIWTLEATSYTITADGLLQLALANGTVRQFEMEEWIDIRPANDGARWGPSSQSQSPP
jgi:hypothetical protein